MLAAGHEVALHGADHRRLTELDPDEVPAILRDARAELEDVAGVPITWFRPPYGSQSRATWQAVRSAGLTPVLWSIDCNDWRTQSLDEYLAPVRQPSLPGGIVLMHDGFADALDGVEDGAPPRLDKPRLTRSVLDEAEQRGLAVQSVGDALEKAAPAWRIWLDEPELGELTGSAHRGERGRQLLEDVRVDVRSRRGGGRGRRRRGPRRTRRRPPPRRTRRRAGRPAARLAPGCRRRAPPVLRRWGTGRRPASA